MTHACLCLSSQEDIQCANLNEMQLVPQNNFLGTAAKGAGDSLVGQIDDDH